MNSLQGKIHSFFSKFNQQNYTKGELLIRADEQPKAIFYLEEGMIKVYSISQKGNEQVLNLFKPGAFFPMSWALNDTKNKYFYEAATPIVLRKIPKETALQFLSENNDVVLDLLKRVYKGIDGLLTRLDSLMMGSAYLQLLTEITIYVKRFGEKDNDSLSIKITEMDLADGAGLTRETVSREMRKLKEKGLVTFSKNILTVPDLSLLEQELQTF